MIRRDGDIVIVPGVGAFPASTLQASLNPKGGIDLYDSAKGRYLFIKQPAARFGAQTDAAALELLSAATAPAPEFKGHSGVPPGSVEQTLALLIDTKQNLYDDDLVGLLNSALEI